MVAGERSDPQAGVDYPGSWDAFLDWFPHEEACRTYLAGVRWPDGFVCPACGGHQAWQTTRGQWMCAGCQKQTSVTAGTIFAGTRTPLTTWFAAAWYVTNQKFGASALGLKRVLGLGGYQTAWTLLHKLRTAMVRPDRDRLGGIVEVDESYVGGVETGVHGRKTQSKAIVAIALEIHDPRGYGRVRLRRMPDVTAPTLTGFICHTVRSGSQVRSDGWPGYTRLTDHSYTHRATSLSATGDPAHVSMPGVHRIASLLKRWLLGTHQGAVPPQHLDAYLDEYTFRFNRRTTRQRGLLFHRLMQQAVMTPPPSTRTSPANPRPQHVVGTGLNWIATFPHNWQGARSVGATKSLRIESPPKIDSLPSVWFLLPWVSSL